MTFSLTAKNRYLKTDSRDSMVFMYISRVKCFELGICCFYENSNLKMKFFCTSHKSFRLEKQLFE